jgi:hypothetical protein
MAFSDWAFATNGAHDSTKWSAFTHSTAPAPLAGHGTYGARAANQVTMNYTPAGSFSTASVGTRVLNGLFLLRSTTASGNQNSTNFRAYIGMKDATNTPTQFNFAINFNGLFFGMTRNSASNDIYLRCFTAGTNSTWPTSGTELLFSNLTTTLTDFPFSWNEWVRLQLLVNYPTATSMRIRARYGGVGATSPLYEVLDTTITSAHVRWRATYANSFVIGGSVSSVNTTKFVVVDAVGYQDIVE